MVRASAFRTRRWVCATNRRGKNEVGMLNGHNHSSTSQTYPGVEQAQALTQLGEDIRCKNRHFSCAVGVFHKHAKVPAHISTTSAQRQHNTSTHQHNVSTTSAQHLHTSAQRQHNISTHQHTSAQHLHTSAQRQHNTCTHQHTSAQHLHTSAHISTTPAQHQHNISTTSAHISTTSAQHRHNISTTSAQHQLVVRKLLAITGCQGIPHVTRLRM